MESVANNNDISQETKQSTVMSPAEMNAIKYIRDHTVVTPSVLKSIR